jgi:hypothetical protein
MYQPIFAISTSPVRQDCGAAVKIADQVFSQQVVVRVWPASYIGAASTSALY